MMKFLIILAVSLIAFSCQSDSSTDIKPTQKVTEKIMEPVNKAVTPGKEAVKEVKDVIEEKIEKPKVEKKEVVAKKAKTVTNNIVTKAKTKAKVKEKVKPAHKPKKKVVKGKPVLKFYSDYFDFGTIEPGDKFNHEFQFVNEGDAPLLINDATATCGCTTPGFPFIPIEPGETGKITVSYDSHGKLGNQSPSITVLTNAGTYKIQMKGKVFPKRPPVEENTKKDSL